MRNELLWAALGAASLAFGAGVGACTGPEPHVEEAAPSAPIEDAPLPSPLDRPAHVTTTPTPAPEPPTAEDAGVADEAPEAGPTLLERGPLRLRRLIVSRGVEAREPVGEGDVLPTGTRVYAFLEAVNETDGEVRLRVTFEPADGEAVGHIGLRVPPTRRWRTWAYTRNIQRPGRWEAVVRAPDGTVLARRAFRVEDDAA